MKAIHLTAYGEPTSVLKVVDIPEPPAPSAGEVLIELDYAPVNISDLLLARGYYFLRPELPSVIGGEGTGIVVSVGPNVSTVKSGDRVTVPFGTFAWAQKVLAPAAGVFVVPEKVSPEHAAMLNINPTTAVLLLTEYLTLKPGAWVALNAANSGVGRSVIAAAKSLGLKTVCIVRRPELIDELKALGADFVAVDSPELAEEVKAATNGEPIELGLDAVGGASADTLAKVLTANGKIVVYALMSGEPVHVNQGDLVGKRLTVEGFWMYYPQFLPKLASATAFAAEMVRKGDLELPVDAIYSVTEIAAAVEHVQKGGKALLDFRS